MERAVSGRNQGWSGGKRDRGFVLMSVYLVLLVLTALAAAFLWRDHAFMTASRRNLNRIGAFNAAEAGLNHAIHQLRTDFNYAGAADFVDFSTGQFSGRFRTVVCPTFNQTVCNELMAGLGLDPLPSGSPVRWVHSIGEAPGDESTFAEARTVTAYVRWDSSSLFQFGVFADQSIRMEGNASTDSYDSTGEEITIAEGDIGVNSTAAGAIHLQGNVRINGSIQVGEGGDPSTVVSTVGNVSISGSEAPAQESLDYEIIGPDTMPSTLEPLEVTTGTYVLSEGTHVFSSLTIGGNAKLQANGPVKIYVDGPVSIGGTGIATANNNPANFQIYVTAEENNNVSLSGNESFYGTIYAPKSVMTKSGNASIYGAVVCSRYTDDGNTRLRFDVSLRRILGGPNQAFRVLSWSEQ